MFGKKKKNRKDNHYVPDVKKRSGRLRSLRLRMAFGAIVISTALVAGAFIFLQGGDFFLRQFVYRNPSFEIERLDISTDGIIPPEEIQRWASVKKGINLVALDLGRVKRDLEHVPLIQTAFVERVLPRTLIIRVVEREPVAKVNMYQPRPSDGLLEASVYFLDAEGMLMPPLARSFNPKHFDSSTRFLPSILGIPGSELWPGHLCVNQQALAALGWIRRFQHSELPGTVDLRSIDISNPGTLLVNTGSGAEITFASSNFDTQLARWQKINLFARKNDKLLASLDLAVSNYVPIAWQESTNFIPSSPQPSKPAPYKKRHV